MSRERGNLPPPVSSEAAIAGLGMVTADWADRGWERTWILPGPTAITPDFYEKMQAGIAEQLPNQAPDAQVRVATGWAEVPVGVEQKDKTAEDELFAYRYGRRLCLFVNLTDTGDEAYTQRARHAAAVLTKRWRGRRPLSDEAITELSRFLRGNTDDINLREIPLERPGSRAPLKLTAEMLGRRQGLPSWPTREHTLQPESPPYGKYTLIGAAALWAARKILRSP